MYKSIIEQMKCYEKSKLTNWTNKAKFLTVRQMNSNILVCVKTNDETSKQNYKIINIWFVSCYIKFGKPQYLLIH